MDEGWYDRAVKVVEAGIPSQYVESERMRRKVATGCVDDLLDSGLVERADELEALFRLQETRMSEAVAAWRAEDPENRQLVMPDLGALLEWLMIRAGLKDPDDG